MFSILLAGSLALINPATVGFDPKVHCGASQASFGMSLDAVSVNGRKPRMRSLESLAAVAASVTDVQGWIGWDDYGHPWIEFAPDGNRLKEAMSGKYVIFPNSNSLFAPLKDNAFTPPPGYKLQACIFVIAQPS